jgi:serine/threonine-protein kinase
MTPDPPHEPARRKLGRYELLSKLGAGGMGEVYRARDLDLGREVAIKVLPDHLSSDREALARFRREARAVAALSHPNILAIFDFGTADDVSFAVMELLHGETLRARLERGSLGWQQVLDIGSGLIEGLAAAHDKGITHRDLKPENIFLTSDGQVKILDFGLARVSPASSPDAETLNATTVEATTPGALMGTAGYMSPEQVRGERVGPASDVFAFGCVLYETLTGHRAFARKTFAETLAAILHDAPPPLSRSETNVPASLERLIGRCLEKSSVSRYPSARELLPDWNGLAEGRRRRFFDTIRPPQAAAVTAIVALVAVAGWLGPRWMSDRRSLDSLAVLPFLNASADPELEYLGDGVSETIGHTLSRLPTLKVMSRNSVVHYKGKEVDARIVGQELGVAAVLLGRLALHGTELSLSVELVQARDRKLLWGEQYIRSYSGILDVQAEIAKEISRELRLRLTSEQEQRLARRDTNDPEAYRLYLQGRFHSSQWTTGGFKQGIEYMHKAIERDPTYALAYAGLAACYADASGLYLVPGEAMPKAKAAATRALELDETLAEAHASLAQILAQYEWNWTDARREYVRAIELNPNDARAFMYYAIYLFEQGEVDPAIVAMQRASELDPLTPTIQSTLAWCYYLAGRLDEAVARLRRLLDEHPGFAMGHYTLGTCLEARGMYDEAITSIRTANEIDPPSVFILSLLGHAYALAGRREDALAVVRQLEQISEHRYLDPFCLARIHVGLGDQESTIVYLRQAYTNRSEELLFLKVDPHFDSMRSDPRFLQLLRGLGLAS